MGWGKWVAVALGTAAAAVLAPVAAPVVLIGGGIAAAATTTGATAVSGAAAALAAKKIIEATTPRTQPVYGCIVYCELVGGMAEHTGVYVGHDRIVELNGDGSIRIVSASEFVSGSNVRTGSIIRVACDRESGTVIADDNVGLRAESVVGERTHYQVVLNNCHQFVAGCITDEFDNATNFMWMLKDLIRDNMNDGRDVAWYIWDR